MWGTVLVFALISATEPIRIGVTALLVALPRPMLNMFAYWLGLMTSGFGLAVVALCLLRDFTLPVVRVLTSAIESPIVPPIQISFGVVALLLAVMFALRFPARQAASVSAMVGEQSGLGGTKTTVFSRLSWPALVERGSTRMAFFAGLGTSTPPLEYWGAIMAILASGAAAGTQLSAALLFILVSFAIAEFPLVSYLVSPAKTQVVVMQLHGWLRAHRQPLFVFCLGMFGALMIAGGAGLV